jgi:hypothetical protein
MQAEEKLLVVLTLFRYASSFLPLFISFVLFILLIKPAAFSLYPHPLAVLNAWPMPIYSTF